MELQIKIKSPPGNFYLIHPDDIARSLIGQQFSVATNSELIKNDRKDLLDCGFAVNIDQVILLFEELGEINSANYWREYLSNHPSANFLLFYNDEELELIY